MANEDYVPLLDEKACDVRFSSGHVKLGNHRRDLEGGKRLIIRYALTVDDFFLTLSPSGLILTFDTRLVYNNENKALITIYKTK